MFRLLVLDDHESVAYSTGVLLRREGYHAAAQYLIVAYEGQAYIPSKHLEGP